MFYTYAHYTPKGDLFYIGKGRGGRAYSTDGRNSFWKNVVAKHGKPYVHIVRHWESEKEAFCHEVELISKFKALGIRLCNMTKGGEGQVGMVPWNKGVPWDDETKAKVSKSRKGIPAWNKGRPLSEKCKQKLSVAMSGRTSWNKGKKHTPEHSEKVGLTKVGNLNCLKYKIVGINKNDNERLEFIGAKAVNASGFQHTAVYMCINGKRKSHRGYTWHKEMLE